MPEESHACACGQDRRKQIAIFGNWINEAWKILRLFTRNVFLAHVCYYHF